MMFQETILLQSSGLKSKTSKKPTEAGRMLNCIWNAWCYKPEDHIIHSHCHENLKSNSIKHAYLCPMLKIFPERPWLQTRYWLVHLFLLVQKSVFVAAVWLLIFTYFPTDFISIRYKLIGRHFWTIRNVAVN